MTAAIIYNAQHDSHCHLWATIRKFGPALCAGDGNSLETSEEELMNLNHKFELAARPVGLPKRSDWKYVEEPVREVRDGELLVKILYISLDPAMRGWINEGKSYVPPGGIGEVMRAGGLGRVVESKN